MSRNLVIVLIVLLVLGAGAGIYFSQKGAVPEEKPKLSPQEALRKWYEAVVNGDWDWVFENTVNVDGKPYSEQCKTKVKEMLGSWVGAKYSLELEPVTRSCMGTLFTPGVSQSEIENLERLGCEAIGYSLDMEAIEAGKFSVSGASHWLLPQEGKWKVVFLCKEIIEKPAPGVEKEIWPTEPKQKALASCQRTSDPESCKGVIERNSAKCEDASCYLYVAAQKKDPIICEEIGEETSSERNLKLLCKAIANEDVNQCQMEKELGMYGGHECNLWLALIKNNSNLCDSAICRALIKKDPKICLQVEWDEEECYFYLAALTQNTELCKALDGNELIGERAACTRVADRDISGLDCQISKGSQYDICKAVAILNEDPSICKRLPYDGSSCYEYVAYTIAKVIPKPYVLYKEIGRVSSIETIAKTCTEIGGEILPPGQGCMGTIVETIDTTLCCVKTKGTFIQSDISVLKTPFKAEEAYKAVKCTIEPSGEDLRGFVVYILRKEGKIFDLSLAFGMVDTTPTVFSSSGSCISASAVPSEGNYSLQIAVFECDPVEEKFGVPCKKEEIDPILGKIVKEIQPFHLSEEKSFSVIE